MRQSRQTKTRGGPIHRGRNSFYPALQLVLVVLVALLAPLCPADETKPDEVSIDEMNSLSLEDLLGVEVVSVSKRSESLSGAAAAVFVVTQEDIRRSGAESLPEALRLVPGLNVRRFDTNKWAISARGFSAIHSNKLLVLIDGRSIYLPAFSGVFWAAHDIDLEEIHHIEVIRGPGGTVWGANAVNGVINIITRAAQAEDGSSLSLAAGSLDPQWRATVRHSGRLGSSAQFRVYAKGNRRGPGGLAEGGDAPDELTDKRVGARIDWVRSDDSHFMVQLGAYDSRSDAEYDVFVASPQLLERVSTENRLQGAHLLARWERQAAGDTATTIQFYADYSEFDLHVVGDQLLRLDLDLTHRREWGRHHTLVGGVGYRRDDDHIRPSLTISTAKPDRELGLASAFVQDEVRAFEDRLKVTAGVKFEYNSFTGLETQPSIRLAWQEPRRALWAAFSRAVRTPSRETDDFRANTRITPTAGLPLLAASFGNSDLVAESVISLEAGYRTHLGRKATLDLAVFHSRYHDLIDYRPGEVTFEMGELPPHLLLPLNADNSFSATSKGGEIALGIEVGAAWRLRLAYSHTTIDYESSTSILPGLTVLHDPGHDPENLASLRASFSPAGPWRFDGILSYVDERPAQGLDSTVTTDVIAAYQAGGNFRVEVVGRNLFEDDHLEYNYFFFGAPPTEVGPSWLLRGRWGF